MDGEKIIDHLNRRLPQTKRLIGLDDYEITEVRSSSYKNIGYNIISCMDKRGDIDIIIFDVLIDSWIKEIELKSKLFSQAEGLLSDLKIQVDLLEIMNSGDEGEDRTIFIVTGSHEDFDSEDDNIILKGLLYCELRAKDFPAYQIVSGQESASNIKGLINIDNFILV